MPSQWGRCPAATAWAGTALSPLLVWVQLGLEGGERGERNTRLTETLPVRVCVCEWRDGLVDVWVDVWVGGWISIWLICIHVPAYL